MGGCEISGKHYAILDKGCELSVDFGICRGWGSLNHSLMDTVGVTAMHQA